MQKKLTHRKDAKILRRIIMVLIYPKLKTQQEFLLK
jgi:hypothetical protein